MNPRQVPLSLLLALKLSKSEQSTVGSERPNQMGVGVGWSGGGAVCRTTAKANCYPSLAFLSPPRPPCWPDWVLPRDRMQRQQQPSRLAGRASGPILLQRFLNAVTLHLTPA